MKADMTSIGKKSRNQANCGFFSACHSVARSPNLPPILPPSELRSYAEGKPHGGAAKHSTKNVSEEISVGGRCGSKCFFLDVVFSIFAKKCLFDGSSTKTRCLVALFLSKELQKDDPPPLPGKGERKKDVCFPSERPFLKEKTCVFK